VEKPKERQKKGNKGMKKTGSIVRENQAKERRQERTKRRGGKRQDDGKTIEEILETRRRADGGYRRSNHLFVPSFK